MNNRRYQIGTVSKYGIFETDTLGNDPGTTCFDTEREAAENIDALDAYFGAICEHNPYAILDTLTRRHAEYTPQKTEAAR